MSQFVITLAQICNFEAAPICNTSLSQFVIDIYFCYWVLLLLLYPLWFRVRMTDPLSHVTHWSCDHEIFFKTFISTFASTIATNFIKMWLKSSWIQLLSQVTQKYASPVSQRQWKLNLKGLWFRVKSLMKLFTIVFFC